jgi:hypothetical protein
VAGLLVGAALLRSSPAADMVVEIGEAIVVVDGFRAEDGVEPVAYQEGVELLAAYEISDGRLDGTVDPDAARIWQHVVAVFPPTQLARLSQFAVIGDGPGGNLAMVHRSERHADGWILSIDPTDAVTTELLRRTLVHELAHLLTLSRSDVVIDPELDPAACAEVPVDIGCARPGSVIADYHTRFWATGEPGAGERSAHDHVTPYAATSSAEDLAETFTAAVLALPVGHGPGVEEKLAWVRARPELAAAADELRTRLGR